MNTLRRFSRRAPVLHGYLMAMLILMPAPLPQVQAEEYPPEEVWSYVRSESAVTITLSAPEGTTELPPQGQRTVAVLLESTSWQVWESNLGGSENREESTQPTSGTVTLAVVSGGGTLSASEVTTDVQGLASATFVMGGHMTNMVTATHGGTVATLEFQPGPEEWTYSHPEESLYALIEPVGTVASPLPAGQSCQTRVRARHDTWDVYTSNWGGLDTRGHVSTPAGGAAFVWTVEGGGDGVLSGTLSGQLDEQGEGVVDFTMGALDTRVRVDVDYAGSGVTYATYEFSSGVAWSYDHSEGFVSATLSAPGGTTNVPAGTWRAAHVDVIYTGWEVWTDGQGGTQIRNHLAGPAVNAPVSLSVPGGTCGLSASAGNADANGRWSFEFNMNENPSSLLAQVSYAEAQASTTLDLSPLTWTKLSDVSALEVTVGGDGSTAAGQQMTAEVTYAQWSVWVSSLGVVQERDRTESPADNAGVTFSITGNGNGVLVNPATSTGLDGRARAGFTAGAVASVVRVVASFNNLSAEATVDMPHVDSDGDGYSNTDEIAAGTDPFEPRDYPGHRYVPLSITLAALPDGEAGLPYTATPSASVTGGTNVGTVSFSGPMFDLNGNPQPWTPTAEGSYTVTASVSDENGSASASTSVTVLPEAPYVLVGGNTGYEMVREGDPVTFPVTVTRRGAPAPGRSVTFSTGASVMTDASGQASVQFNPPVGPSIHTAAAEGQSVSLYVFVRKQVVPTGTPTMSGAGNAWLPEPQPRPGPAIPMMEIRSIAVESGELAASESQIFSRPLPGSPPAVETVTLGNSISLGGTRWTTNDPAVNANHAAYGDTPPPFDDLEWTEGSATAWNEELPDSVDHELTDLDIDVGPPPYWSGDPGAVQDGGTLGRRTGHSSTGTFQFRLRRPGTGGGGGGGGNPPPENTSSEGKPELSRTLVVLTRKISDGSIVTATTITVTIPEDDDLSSETTYAVPGVGRRVSLLPVEVDCPELYMFSGHTGDNVQLCIVDGIACEWKLKDATPAIGTFNNPTSTACSFTATMEGKNTIQLVIGGNVVWEKPTEVIDIVTRASWGALAPKPHTEIMPDFQHVTLHHTSNTNTGSAEMRSIQEYHMRSTWQLGKGFDDIGYHLVMDKAGVVYEGRQLEAAPGTPGGPYTKGEHVGANNTVAGIGFCTMGDYEGTEGNEAWPASRQKHLEKAVSALCRRYNIPASKISYHKSLAVAANPSLCPGSNYIPSIPDIINHVTENLQ